MTPEDIPESQSAFDSFMTDIERELARARAKFPGDRLTMIALVEEVGELAKAMLDEPSERVWREAIQVATMAARIALDGDSSVRELRKEQGLDRLAARLDRAGGERTSVAP